MTKLRITNNGLFDLHVDFVLKSKVRQPLSPWRIMIAFP